MYDRVDGKRCLFDFCLPILNLYVMANGGSQIRQLATDADCGAWSPYGSRIAYHASFNGLFVVNADGTGKQRVADTDAGCPVVWSPDGSAIAYAVGRSDGSSDLVVSPLAGRPGAALASSPESEFPESWR